MVYLKVLQDSQENSCVPVSFLIKLQASVYYYEFCEILKESFFIKHLRAATSVISSKPLRFSWFYVGGFIITCWLMNDMMVYNPAKFGY